MWSNPKWLEIASKSKSLLPFSGVIDVFFCQFIRNCKMFLCFCCLTSFFFFVFCFLNGFFFLSCLRWNLFLFLFFYTSLVSFKSAWKPATVSHVNTWVLTSLCDFRKRIILVGFKVVNRNTYKSHLNNFKFNF